MRSDYREINKTEVGFRVGVTLSEQTSSPELANALMGNGRMIRSVQIQTEMLKNIVEIFLRRMEVITEKCAKS